MIQLKKEFLAIMYTCEQNWLYLFERPFTVFTDRNPLVLDVHYKVMHA